MKKVNKKINIHLTAEVSPLAKIGEGSFIWHQAQVREKSVIGKNCIVGKGVYVDKGVKIGNNCKLQNYCCVFHGSILEDGVFIGPTAQILNDKYPRATTPEGKLKSDSDWKARQTIIGKGASIGAGVLILPGIKIGKFALVGAGAVVTKDVPAYTLVYGNPAKIIGKVNKEGKVVNKK